MVAAAEDECPVHQNADNTITIKIVAKPGAKHNSVTGVVTRQLLHYQTD